MAELAKEKQNHIPLGKEFRWHSNRSVVLFPRGVLSRNSDNCTKGIQLHNINDIIHSIAPNFAVSSYF